MKTPINTGGRDGDGWAVLPMALPGFPTPLLSPRGFARCCPSPIALPGTLIHSWAGIGTCGALQGAPRGRRCVCLGGEVVGRRMGPGSTVPGTGLASKHSWGRGFASGAGAQDLHAQSGCGICMHGLARAPTRRLCAPGLLYVPTELGDCVTFLSTANFSSTSYTTYMCCKQLFARWVGRSRTALLGDRGGGVAACPDPASLLPARCSRTGRSPSRDPGPAWGTACCA